MTIKFFLQYNKLLIRTRGTTPLSQSEDRIFKSVLPEIAKPTAKLQLIF